MEAILEIFVNYGPYVGLAFGINAIVFGLKSKLFKEFFKSNLGSKLGWMLPLALGLVGGFLLDGESVKSCLLTGLGIGATSHIFYKFFTKTLASNKAEKTEEGNE